MTMLALRLPADCGLNSTDTLQAVPAASEVLTVHEVLVAGVFGEVAVCARLAVAHLGCRNQGALHSPPTRGVESMPDEDRDLNPPQAGPGGSFRQLLGATPSNGQPDSRGAKSTVCFDQ